MSTEVNPTVEVHDSATPEQMLPENQEGLLDQQTPKETQGYDTQNSQVAIAGSPMPGQASPPTPRTDLAIEKVPAVERMSWTDIQMVHKQNYCQKCGELVEATSAKAVRKKAHVQLTCKACHNLVTMLYKNWDLKKLGSREMSDSDTKDFYLKCKESLGTGGKFDKSKIKVLLQQKLTEREVASTERAIKGKFLPLSVYASKGFDTGPIKRKAEKQESDLSLVKTKFETVCLRFVFLGYICYCYIRFSPV